MTYIFESLYQSDAKPQATEGSNDQQNDQAPSNNQNEHKATGSNWNGTIKMMDTILFETGFQPVKWIFTDLLGRIQFKDINSITINDVIRAFLVNLNENKKNEFNNEDLMEFLANNKNRSKICFAIIGNSRHFLDIGSLSDIKNKYPKGIEALQLYKIPTRDFLPYFYYHTLEFKNNGVLQSHMITRVSHFIQDLGNQSHRGNAQEFYEEKIPDEEYNYFAYQMLEISKQLIARIQARDETTIVKSIKITYLIESNNYDPWFIGTEHCYLFMRQQSQTATLDKKSSRVTTAASKSFTNMNRSLGMSSKFQSDQKLKNRSLVKKLKEDVNQSRRSGGVQTSPEFNTNRFSKFQDLNNSIGDQSNINNNPEIFELSTNEYVTQSDLLKGLQQIGEQFGKEPNASTLPIKRPKTMQMLTQEKSRKVVQYQQLMQDQRNKLKEKGRRIIQLFPRYLEKSGSKPHAQFLFGNMSSERVFKDYQRLRFQKQINPDQFSLIKSESQLNQNLTSQSFYNANNNRSIFDIPMSDVNYAFDKSLLTELPYQDNYFNKNANLQHTVPQLTEMGDQLILNKDISMFQNQTDGLSIKDSVKSLKPIHNNLHDKTVLNDFLNKSLQETQQQVQPKLKLAETDLERNIISMLMMNQDLGNVVVLEDKGKVIDQIKQKMKYEEQRQLAASQLTTESDQIFTGRRRKLEFEEARTYMQWRQLAQDRSVLNQESPMMMGNDYQGGVNLPLQLQMPISKRSKTTLGTRKSAGKKKPTVLSLLQIKGQEAKIEFQSKNNLNKIKAHH